MVLARAVIRLVADGARAVLCLFATGMLAVYVCSRCALLAYCSLLAAGARCARAA